MSETRNYILQKKSSNFGKNKNLKQFTMNSMTNIDSQVAMCYLLTEMPLSEWLLLIGGEKGEQVTDTNTQNEKK